MSLEVASFVVRPQWWNDLAAALPQQFPKLLHLGLEASEWFAGAALFRQAEAPLAPLALPPHLTSLALCLLMSAHDLGKLLGPVLAAEASDSRPARLRRLHLEVGDRAGPMVPPFLPLGALPGLEALTLRHQMLVRTWGACGCRWPPMRRRGPSTLMLDGPCACLYRWPALPCTPHLQIPPPSQLCRLAPSLASLELDLHVLGVSRGGLSGSFGCLDQVDATRRQHSCATYLGPPLLRPQPRHAILLLAMLGREMAGLQNLALLRARYTPELALASLSGEGGVGALTLCRLPATCRVGRLVRGRCRPPPCARPRAPQACRGSRP